MINIADIHDCFGCGVCAKACRKMNRKMMEGCAGLGTLLHLPLNTERLRKLTENYVVSNEKIKAALGIERMPVRAADGIMKTIKSFSN